MIPRKRNRIISVCSFCRQRKVRCDKKTPCSNCVKYKNPHCDYGYEVRKDSYDVLKQEQDIIGELTRLKDQFQKLQVELDEKSKAIRLQGHISPGIMFSYDDLKEARQTMQDSIKNMMFQIDSDISETKNYTVKESLVYRKAMLQILELDEPDKSLEAGDSFISLAGFHKQSPILEENSPKYTGSFSLTGLVHTDHELKSLHNFLQNNIDPKTKEALVPNSVARCEIENIFLGPKPQLLNLSAPGSNNNSFDVSKDSNNNEWLFASPQSAYGIDLVSRVCASLPSYHAIWAYIDFFFDHVYPFFPMLDEETFRKDVEKLLGNHPKDFNRPSHLQMHHKSDLAELGLMLVVLRLAFILSNQGDLFAHSSPTLSSVDHIGTVGPEVIKLAQICLNHLSIYNNTKLSVLQLTLFLRYYQWYGPEVSCGTEQDMLQIFSALVVQMAKSLGLHKISETVDNNKTLVLGRKIWQLMVRSNMLAFQIFGDSITPIGGHVDIEGSSITSENSNNSNVSLERLIVDAYNDHSNSQEFTIELYSIISNTTELLNMRTVNILMEITCSNFLLNLDPAIYQTDAAFKNYFIVIKQMTRFCFNYYSVLAFQFQLYNHCCRINNQEGAEIFLLRLIKSVHQKIFPVMQLLAGSTSLSNDEKFVIFMTAPNISQLLQKAFVMYLSLKMKARIALKQLNEKEVQFNSNLVNFEEGISESLEHILSYMNYFGQVTGRVEEIRVTKFMKFLMNCVDHVEVHAEGANCRFYCLTDQNLSLNNSIMEENLIAMRKNNPKITVGVPNQLHESLGSNHNEGLLAPTNNPNLNSGRPEDLAYMINPSAREDFTTPDIFYELYSMDDMFTG